MVLALLLASPSTALRPNTTISPCAGHWTTAKAFEEFAEQTWRLPRWLRPRPRPLVIRAYQSKLQCAAGPGHRKAMKHQWREAKRAFYEHRRRKLATERWEPYVCGGRRFALPCAVTECESGYYFGHHSGAYGLLDSTWSYWGGGRFAPYPGAATPRQQAIVARRVWESVGPSGWECPL